MLDSKKRLFVNISHNQRDLSSLLHHKSSGRKALSVLIQNETTAAEDQVRNIFPVKDEIEEEEASAAALFFDSQPTPVIEMKSFLSNSSGLQKDTHPSAQRNAAAVFSTHELDSDTSSFAHQLLQPPPGYPQSQSDSLSTPVVDPNFAPNFSTASHSLGQMEAVMYDPFQQEQAEYVNPHRLLIDPVVPATPSTGFPLQYADPPQYRDYECDQSSSQNQLPESVLEIHRPSVSSVAPSESSSSSPPPSPKAGQTENLKRKRSDSDRDCKKGRMTKKQQFDALCSRKSQLEEDNFNLKEKVDGYERACRRLKQMLYNRIKQQRA